MEAAVRGEPTPPLEDPSPALRVNGAAFVTLRSNGTLRGCMGHPQPRQPLWQCVAEMAEAAATRDPRFPLLRPEEPVAVDVSVLSAMRPARLEEIHVGIHGLYVRLDGRTGLLLPQVAVEWGWNASQFFEHACRKAGFPDNGNEVSPEIFSFTVERFDEESA